MNDDRNKVETSEMLKVFWKSFLIQASWSFDHMQSLGFAYAIQPVLRKLYPDQAEYESRLRAHMEYFNTQPYLASFILGAVARMEQDRALGRNSSTDVLSLKTALMAPLGALGDSFVWGSLKPFSAVVAVSLLMADAWWAPIVFLILYNVVHVGLRAEMLFHGFISAGNAAELIARYHLTKMAKLFKAVSLTVLGGILGMLPTWRLEFKMDLPLPSAVSAFAGLVATLILVAILRRGGSPVKLMLGLAALCLALAYGGVI
ncbi:MAG TPA: PTS system mannose/fructose/sorbose family transporter subunit IID [Nitrospirota bacterium]|nr:PTS system mannose/fructose/sorbose family transporter subunit IID [Nitrospirota bacterium]